jgi:DNA-binding XRE family transcriptional regulator
MTGGRPSHGVGDFGEEADMTDAEPGPLHAESSAAGIFAAELKAQRGRLGWTQVQLGQRIGYSGSFISDVERGARVSVLGCLGRVRPAVW